MKAYLDNNIVGAIAKDDHPAESEALDRLTAAQALENTPLNPEWRRGVGPNVHQAHFSATRQTLHGYPQPLSSGGKFSAPKFG